MQRGDLVTLSLHGDYEKPRPAVIVQSNLLSDLESVVLCPITSDLRDAVFRVTIEPNPSNGLRALSQVRWTSWRPYQGAKLAPLLAVWTRAR